MPNDIGQLDPSVAAVVIGRNEGARLAACLESLRNRVAEVVYVDSGSTDDSVDAARTRGALVVELDTKIPFTAARARNAGAAQLSKDVEFVQFVDGDCTIHPNWIATGLAALENDTSLAVVCGRRREIFPEVSVYNGLIDKEWDTPIGEAKACGGDALMRRAAFEAVGGFNPRLIAGEEPELCVRLRRQGWKILRVDAEMTSHDANITRFGQWWSRACRAGYAFAAGASLHGGPPERHYALERRRAVRWGAALPSVALLGAFFVTPWALALLVLYPAQVFRLWLRRGDLIEAFFLTLGKLPEGQGVFLFLLDQVRRRDRTLIEYK